MAPRRKESVAAIGILIIVAPTTPAAFMIPVQRIFLHAAPAPSNLNFINSRKSLFTPLKCLSCPPDDSPAETCTNANENIVRGEQDAVGYGVVAHKDVIDGGDGEVSPLCNESKPSLPAIAAIAQPLLFAAATVAGIGLHPSGAAVTGGRIGGGYDVPDRTPSAPPIQRQKQVYQSPQQQYKPPSAGRDIQGTGGIRVHIDFRGKEGSRRGNRIRYNPSAGDITSDPITAGDIAIVGGLSAGVMAIQRYNRRRFLHEGGGGYGVGSSASSTAISGRETAVISSLQLSMICDRQAEGGNLLSTLENLSKTADVKKPRGLSTLIKEVCLTLLRSERDWIGGTGSIKEYRPDAIGTRQGRGDKNSSPRSRAKRDFNRAVTRERSKWERETISNTPDRSFSATTTTDPESRGFGLSKSTHAVVTLMIAWAGLRSHHPSSESRKGPRPWRAGKDGDDDARDIVFSVANRKSAVALLEWIGDEAAEGGGENMLDVEVLWTPADPEDLLDKEDLDVKWPELIGL